jgi:hypothetical protein
MKQVVLILMGSLVLAGCATSRPVAYVPPCPGCITLAPAVPVEEGYAPPGPVVMQYLYSNTSRR